MTSNTEVTRKSNQNYDLLSYTDYQHIHLLLSQSLSSSTSSSIHIPNPVLIGSRAAYFHNPSFRNWDTLNGPPPSTDWDLIAHAIFVLHYLETLKEEDAIQQVTMVEVYYKVLCLKE